MNAAAEQAIAALGEVVERSPFAYASTWPLERLVVASTGGTSRPLLLKTYPARTGVKPESVFDPDREAAAYALLAAHVGAAAAPRCLAAGPGWLLLEQLDGYPLWQSATLRDWEAAARWAARLHEAFATAPLDEPHLIHRDAAHNRTWFARACDQCPGLLMLNEAAERAIVRLERLPRTLLHGELYPSNVLVTDGRIAAVDWEMAAVGPGVIDLAALVTGWEEESARTLIEAYGGADRRDLAAARLVLATQWLGWSVTWDPPPEHRRDWLLEAQTAATVLT